MNRFLELAEWVEAAPVPDRELDALIWCKLNPRYRYVGSPPGHVRWRWWGTMASPCFTSSLDAAMTLPGRVRQIRWSTSNVFAEAWRDDEMGWISIGSANGVGPDAAARAVTAAKLRAGQ